MPFTVHYVEETGSTNADLLARAQAGAPIGTVVRAGYQTAGRGRRGRIWQAPPGRSLLASILLETEAVPFLSVARVALAAADACGEVPGVQAALKWPNDLVVGDRKLAGLLAETHGSAAGSSGIVVGIGCNVDWPPPAALPDNLAGLVVALSHLAPAGQVPSVSDLLDSLLGYLATWLLAPAGDILAAYRSRCATLGQLVCVTAPDSVIEGVATGITALGELEVTLGSRIEVVRAGDVVHVRRHQEADPTAS